MSLHRRICAVAFCFAAIATAAPATHYPTASAGPSAKDCSFTGNNPALPVARSETQRFLQYRPAMLQLGVGVDNAFDYYYRQLIPGAIEWSVGSTCQQLAQTYGGHPLAIEYRDAEPKQGLVLGHAILMAVVTCKGSSAEAPGTSHVPQATEAIQHMCPQYL
jgi:hypothetical protein